MALTKAQSRAIILDWKAELDAVNAQIDADSLVVQQAKMRIANNTKNREPMVEELRAMIERHKRVFAEDPS